jgi:fluoride exporter
VTPLLVALGAAAGAALRFWVGHHLDTVHSGVHWGTLLVNVAGSFVLGLLVGTAPSDEALALLGTGLCGGLTTYSAFAVQTRDRSRDSGPAAGAAYAAATIGLALGACALGFLVGDSAG